MKTGDVFKQLKEDGAKLYNERFDTIVIGFIADVLYIKGLICLEEYEDIMESCNFNDLDNIVEKMLRGEYNVFKRGEGYVGVDRGNAI